MKYIFKIILITIIISFFVGCGGNNTSDTAKSNEKKDVKSDELTTNKGVGPISTVAISDEIDMTLVSKGKEIYELKCTACHKPKEKFIGPPPFGIMERRSPEWIMNMILNPEGMIQQDPVAKQLLIDYNFAPMANQGLTEEEARAILEYFRTLK